MTGPSYTENCEDAGGFQSFSNVSSYESQYDSPGNYSKPTVEAEHVEMANLSPTDTYETMTLSHSPSAEWSIISSGDIQPVTPDTPIDSSEDHFTSEQATNAGKEALLAQNQELKDQIQGIQAIVAKERKHHAKKEQQRNEDKKRTDFQLAETRNNNWNLMLGASQMETEIQYLREELERRNRKVMDQITAHRKTIHDFDMERMELGFSHFKDQRYLKVKLQGYFDNKSQSLFHDLMTSHGKADTLTTHNKRLKLTNFGLENTNLLLSTANFLLNSKISNFHSKSKREIARLEAEVEEEKEIRLNEKLVLMKRLEYLKTEVEEDRGIRLNETLVLMKSFEYLKTEVEEERNIRLNEKSVLMKKLERLKAREKEVVEAATTKHDTTNQEMEELKSFFKGFLLLAWLAYTGYGILRLFLNLPAWITQAVVFLEEI